MNVGQSTFNGLRIVSAIIVGCLLVTGVFMPVSSQQLEAKQTVKLTINDPRPMAVAVRQLQERHKVVITYEDLRLVNEVDLIDQTDAKYRQSHPNGPRAKSAKSKPLEFSYSEVAVAGKSDNLKAVLQSLMAAYTASGSPGRFELKHVKDVFHVVPLQVRNAQGQMVPQRPILDNTVTFSNKERNVYQTLQLLTQSLSQTTGVKVVVGTIPTNFFIQQRITHGASSEVARDVLMKILAGTGGRFSWQLLYDPGINWAALNIASIPN